MVDDDRGGMLRLRSDTLVTPSKYGERILATCGYFLIVFSLVSFSGVGALKVREAFYPTYKFEKWIDFAVHESGTITLLIVGILTAALGIRLLTKVRMAGTQTIPIDDFPLVQQAVIDGKPEPIDQYVRLRSLSGWAGNFTKLGVTGLPLTTVLLTLIFSAVSLFPTEQAPHFLDLAKLTLGAFIGSFVQRQVEQRRQQDIGGGSPNKADPPRPPLSV